jgi:hypothetical protein
MRRAVIIFLAIFAFGTVSAQQLVEKTLVKPVNLFGNNQIDIMLNGEVSIQEWSNEHAQVEMSITAYGVNSQVLKSLVAAGRYNIKVENKNDTIILSSPNLAKALKVRGNSLKDEVKYILYVPATCTVNKQGEDGMTSIN